MGLAEPGSGYKAGCIDGKHSNAGFGRNPFSLPLSHESGLILQNERCCLGGQPIN
jgi:hypothetical protein